MTCSILVIMMTSSRHTLIQQWVDEGHAVPRPLLVNDWLTQYILENMIRNLFFFSDLQQHR